jgi:hypothetical protein
MLVVGRKEVVVYFPAGTEASKNNAGTNITIATPIFAYRGSWLENARCYSGNLRSLTCSVVHACDKGDNASVTQLQEMFTNSN